MRSKKLFIALVIVATLTLGQNISIEYSALIKKAESLYDAKDYKNSALAYSEAFKINGWKGSLNDYYNAACSWALSNNADSAFFQLTKIATESNYTDYVHITEDSDLNFLHKDKRWELLCDIIKQNKDKAEATLNKPLAAQLDSIYTDDQKYRRQVTDIEKQFGRDSENMKDHWKLIIEKDSINLIKVKTILDNYGWLGADIVGGKGNIAFFLVIQHADLKTQEKYLPMMREAVKNGRASITNLALLEDRVALGEGKKQIYGSQIGWDRETQLYYVQPLEDPDNVDKRRGAVGLQPLANYVNQWKIKWNIEEYKKKLPSIEAKEKAKQK